MRRLVVRGVMGGVVWVWGGWSSLSRVGSGDGVSCGGRGRGDSRWRVSAGVSTSIVRCWLPRVVSVAWSRGGGGGGVVWGWRCWWWGGRGWVLCWLGVWASLWVLWVLRVYAVRPLRFLTGCGAGVWVGGGRMSVRVGLWSVCNGWLLVDGARWYGVWMGGLLVVVGWGGAGVGVVLAGGLGVPVGRVGVVCVRRVAFAVLDWLWCRGAGGRRPHEPPGGAVVRM